MARSTFSYPAHDHRPSLTPLPEAPASGVRLRGGYSRTRATIERRTPVLRTAPAHANEDLRGELPSVYAIEPFVQAPEHLPARTRVVVACAACTDHGERAADGSCAACAGTGKVAAWVEIVVERDQRVRATGDGAARERHTHLFDGEDFEAREWPNQLLHQAWLRGLPPHLAPGLRPDLAPNERVLWVLVQTFVG